MIKFRPGNISRTYEKLKNAINRKDIKPSFQKERSIWKEEEENNSIYLESSYETFLGGVMPLPFPLKNALLVMYSDGRYYNGQLEIRFVERNVKEILKGEYKNFKRFGNSLINYFGENSLYIFQKTDIDFIATINFGDCGTIERCLENPRCLSSDLERLSEIATEVINKIRIKERKDIDFLLYI